MKRFALEKTLYDRQICTEVTLLDAGLHVLLTGGECTHVGAAALAQGGELLACPSFPEHKEQVVCEHWAREISRQTNGCVTVCGGIHYDHAKPEQIEEILHVCNELLREVQIRIKEVQI